jgi:hypothetical protein
MHVVPEQCKASATPIMRHTLPADPRICFSRSNAGSSKRGNAFYIESEQQPLHVQCVQIVNTKLMRALEANARTGDELG